MYASLLVKTNRISRIFNCARKSAKRPSFISPKSQMLITGILVTIQVSRIQVKRFHHLIIPKSWLMKLLVERVSQKARWKANWKAT